MISILGALFYVKVSAAALTSTSITSLVCESQAIPQVVRFLSTCLPKKALLVLAAAPPPEAQCEDRHEDDETHCPSGSCRVEFEHVDVHVGLAVAHLSVSVEYHG